MDVFYNACARGTNRTYRVAATDTQTQHLFDGTDPSNAATKGMATRVDDSPLPSSSSSSSSPPLMVIITDDDTMEDKTYPIDPPLPEDSSTRVGIRLSPMNDRILVYCHSFIAILDPPWEETPPSFAQATIEIRKWTAYHSTIVWNSKVSPKLKTQISTVRNLSFSPASPSSSSYLSNNSSVTPNFYMIQDIDDGYMGSSPSYGSNTKTKSIDRIEYDRQVLDVQWHPLSAHHFVILTRTGIVFLENFRFSHGKGNDNATVLLTISFPRHWSSSNLPENRTTPTSITFGSPRMGSWDIFTVFILCTNGNVYTISPLIPPGIILTKNEWMALYRRTLDIDKKVERTYRVAQAYHKIPQSILEPLEKEFATLADDERILWESGIRITLLWLENNWYPTKDNGVQYLPDEQNPLFGNRLSPNFNPPSSLEKENVISLQQSVRFTPSLTGPLPIHPAVPFSKHFDACSILIHTPLFDRPTADSYKLYATVFSILYTNGSIVTVMNSTPMIPTWRLVSLLPNPMNITDDGYDIAAYGCLIANDSIHYPKSLATSSSSSSSSSLLTPPTTKSVSINTTRNQIVRGSPQSNKVNSPPVPAIISPFQANQDIQIKRRRRTMGTGATRLCTLRIVNLNPSTEIFTPFIVIDTVHFPFTETPNTPNTKMNGILIRHSSATDEYIVANSSMVITITPSWRSLISYYYKLSESKGIFMDTHAKNIRTSAYINRVWPNFNEHAKWEFYEAHGVNPVDGFVVKDGVVSGVQVWSVPKNYRQSMNELRQLQDKAVRENRQEELYSSGNVPLETYFQTLPLVFENTVGSKSLYNRNYRTDTTRISHVTLQTTDDAVKNDGTVNKETIEARQKHYDTETKQYIFQQLQELKRSRSLYRDKLIELQKSSSSATVPSSSTTTTDTSGTKSRMLTVNDVQQRIKYYDTLLSSLDHSEKYEIWNPDEWVSHIDEYKYLVQNDVSVATDEFVSKYNAEETIEDMDKVQKLKVQAMIAAKYSTDLRECYNRVYDYETLVRGSLISKRGAKEQHDNLVKTVETFINSYPNVEHRIQTCEAKSKQLNWRFNRILRLIQAHTKLEKMKASTGAPFHDVTSAELLKDLQNLQQDVVKRVTPQYEKDLVTLREKLKTLQSGKEKKDKDIEDLMININYLEKELEIYKERLSMLEQKKEANSEPGNDDESSKQFLLHRLSVVAATIANDRCSGKLKESVQALDNLFRSIIVNHHRFLTVENETRQMKEYKQQQQKFQSPSKQFLSLSNTSVRSPLLTNGGSIIGSSGSAITLASPNITLDVDRLSTEADRVIKFTRSVVEHEEVLKNCLDSTKSRLDFIKQKLLPNSHDGTKTENSVSRSASVLPLSSPGSQSSRASMLVTKRTPGTPSTPSIPSTKPGSDNI